MARESLPLRGGFRGRRGARSHDRDVMVWKTQALCATFKPT